MADGLLAIGRRVWPGLSVGPDETRIDIDLVTTAQPVFHQAIAAAVLKARPIRLVNPSGSILMDVAVDAVNTSAAHAGRVPTWSGSDDDLVATFPEDDA